MLFTVLNGYGHAAAMPAAAIAGYHPSQSPGARTIAANTGTGELIAADQFLASAQTMVTPGAFTAPAGNAVPSVSMV